MRGNTIRMMDKDRRKPVPLPSEDDKDYFNLLRLNCIIAYEKFMDDTLALDFNKVIGKMRSLILEDKIYQQETKYLRAKAIYTDLEELGDIQFAIENGFADEEEEELGYDPRGLPGEEKKAKKKRGPNVSDKDLVAMRLKTLETRREMLALNRKKDDVEESDGINIFFVALTESEMRSLDIVEVQDGKEVDDMKDGEEGIITKKKVKNRESGKEVADEGLPVEGVDYRVGPNGEIIQI